MRVADLRPSLSVRSSLKPGSVFGRLTMIGQSDVSPPRVASNAVTRT